MKNNSPKKSLGQNFLRDPKILTKIVDFAKINKGDIIFEVGPGEGTLTKELLKKENKIVAIEKDERMIELLQNKFKDEVANEKLQIINADILNFNLDQFTASFSKTSKLKPLSFSIVGNIPYYITGALFRKIFELENLPKSLTLVVQKEVAERIIARDSKESVLSISVKAYGTPKYGGVIKAGSFFPKPKVDSAIIRIFDISRKNLKKKDEKRFFEILKAGFAHKRKLLIKNLGEISSKSNLEKVFDTLKISKNTRAEDLKVENWLKIAKELKDVK